MLIKKCFKILRFQKMTQRKIKSGDKVIYTGNRFIELRGRQLTVRAIVYELGVQFDEFSTVIYRINDFILAEPDYTPTLKKSEGTGWGFD